MAEPSQWRSATSSRLTPRSAPAGHRPLPRDLLSQPVGSEWYRKLIAKHGMPANQSPIAVRPYPIDPWRCAYLADDDHGPLALQEILLAGCPTVGEEHFTGGAAIGPTGTVQAAPHHANGPPTI